MIEPNLLGADANITRNHSGPHPAAFLSTLAELPPLPDARATARTAFLIAPAAESARDNRYMQMESLLDAQRALAQPVALAQALREGRAR